MECINCSNENNVVQISEETFPCPDCDSEINIVYHACYVCGCVWKTCNGDVVGDSTIRLDELLMEEISILTEDLLSAEDTNEVSNSMEDCIHRCLKCNSICYQEAENLYKCPSCDFEWEVISGD